MVVILLPAMIAALQGPLLAHPWSLRSSRRLRQLGVVPHPFTRGRFPSRLGSSSSVPPPSHEGDLDRDPVLPKGEYHQLPRLYVGPEPSIYRIQAQLAADLQVAHRPPPSASSHPPLLGANARVPLSDEQSHYLTTVLRLLKKNKKRKEVVEPLLRVFDGRSGEWLARVVDDSALEDVDTDGGAADDPNAPAPRKKKNKHNKHRPLLSVECLSLLRPQPTVTATGDENALPHRRRTEFVVWLCVAVPSSKDRFRWLLEKATELNVDNIVLIETEHSSSSSGHDKGSTISLHKAFAYLLEASEQSERLTLPRLTCVSPQGAAASTTLEESDKSSLPTTKLVDLLDWITSSSNMKFLVCRERVGDSTSFLQALKDACTTQCASVENVAFCIGPEGGWSSREESRMDEMQSKLPGVVTNVSLGPTVLRMETAAISALSAYNVFCDDLHRSDRD